MASVTDCFHVLVKINFKLRLFLIQQSACTQTTSLGCSVRCFQTESLRLRDWCCFMQSILLTLLRDSPVSPSDQFADPSHTVSDEYIVLLQQIQKSLIKIK